MRRACSPGANEGTGSQRLTHRPATEAGHFSREFRLTYGESPYSYLMTRRVERAMALLRRGDLAVTEVCFEGDPAGNLIRIQELH